MMGLASVSESRVLLAVCVCVCVILGVSVCVCVILGVDVLCVCCVVGGCFVIVFCRSGRLGARPKEGPCSPSA